jgi:A/G-specific adenine glycosylase
MLVVQTVRELLRQWYHSRRRALPWREEPSPYRVWVSEVMLQQTQVATVIPYFERFVAALPTVAALAAAPEEQVLGLWAGLGYYGRARNLQAAAAQVLARFGGALPRDVEALQSLPGIGRYTAGAIASVAFGVATPVVDGNVARVLSRLMAQETPVDVASGQQRLWASAASLLDPSDPSAHNQALMELGALVCTPRQPDCHACPLRLDCLACEAGDPERYPLKKPKRAPQLARAVSGLARNPRGQVLVARRPARALLGGLWELPGGEVAAGASRRATLAAAWRERLGVSVAVGAHRACVEHIFTHRRLTLDVFEVTGGELAAPSAWYTDARWCSLDALWELPLSRLSEKVFEAVGLVSSEGPPPERGVDPEDPAGV